jgi:hypothetical protein
VMVHADEPRTALLQLMGAALPPELE